MRPDRSNFYDALKKMLPKRYLEAITRFNSDNCPSPDDLAEILSSIRNPYCSGQEVNKATLLATSIAANSKHLQSPVRLGDALSCTRLGVLANQFKPDGWCGERSSLAALELLESNVYARTVEPYSFLPATVIHVCVEFLDMDGNLSLMDPTIRQIIPVEEDIWCGTPEELEKTLCGFLAENPNFTNEYILQKTYYGLEEKCSTEAYASAVFDNIYGYERKPNYGYYLFEDATDDNMATIAMDALSSEMDLLLFEKQVKLLSER